MAKGDVKTKKYRFSDRNLSKYFGLPPIDELGGNYPGRWLDHYYIERVSRNKGDVGDFDRVELVSEPYQLGPEGAEWIMMLCKARGLNLVFSGGARHNAGCMKITIWRGAL